MVKGLQSNNNIFERLSRTETYASASKKRSKEKRRIVKVDVVVGRPLFNIAPPHEEELVVLLNSRHLSTSPSSIVEASIPGVKRSSGNTAGDSNNSACSSSTNLTTTFKRRSGRSSSVFDRLYKTGTTSSLRKHKKSDNYDDTKDKTFYAQDLLRDYGKGHTRLVAGNLK
mmetsp:Transcript_1731/g.3147  ORF Transcript_1731/g.3147 Transcript_1731/m.3147 type:complete len:170 (+) Transcript_1731:135-644(+)